MGFGWLLIGYFCVNVTAQLSPLAAAMPVGYLLMLVGFYRLAPYGRYFHICRNMTFAAIPFGVYFALRGMADVGMLPAFAVFGSVCDRVIDWTYFVFYLVLHGLLLYGVAVLAGELSLPKIKNTALRALSFLAVYQLVYLVANLPISLISGHIGIWIIVVMLLKWMCIFLHLWLFYQCYRYILPEGSDTSPRLRDLVPTEKKK